MRGFSDSPLPLPSSVKTSDGSFVRQTFYNFRFGSFKVHDVWKSYINSHWLLLVLLVPLTIIRANERMENIPCPECESKNTGIVNCQGDYTFDPL